MVRPGKCFPVPRWHAQFLSMLPTIRDHAAATFKHLNFEAREEAIQEAIANAVVVYARLVQLKKVDLGRSTTRLEVAAPLNDSTEDRAHAPTQ